MCYSLYLSTDSPDVLESDSNDRVYFERLAFPPRDPIEDLLVFPNRWFVGSYGGCSCSFRHVIDVGFGFGEPEDWCPEDPDDVEATKRLYHQIAALVAIGYQVDVIDTDGYKLSASNTWVETGPADIRSLEVALSEVRAEEFRLFNNYRFRFMA